MCKFKQKILNDIQKPVTLKQPGLLHILHCRGNGAFFLCSFHYSVVFECCGRIYTGN